MECHILNKNLLIVILLLSNKLYAVEPRVVDLIKNIEVSSGVHFSRPNNKESIAEIVIQKIVQKKIAVFKLEDKSFGVNPSLELCVHLEGSVSTHKNSTGDEIATCTFKDKSYLYTWDAFKIL